jgi:hypothetical protein
LTTKYYREPEDASDRAMQWGSIKRPYATPALFAEYRRGPDLIAIDGPSLLRPAVRLQLPPWSSLQHRQDRVSKRWTPLEDAPDEDEPDGKVVPITPQAAAMFYDRLFVLDPNRSARAP